MPTSSDTRSPATTGARSRWRNWFARSRTGGDDVRQVECAACFQTLPVSEALIVASPQAADDGPGGTAMVAEFHPACCKLVIA